jgi:hypothetical protein
MNEPWLSEGVEQSGDRPTPQDRQDFSDPDPTGLIEGVADFV